MEGTLTVNGVKIHHRGPAAIVVLVIFCCIFACCFVDVFGRCCCSCCCPCSCPKWRRRRSGKGTSCTTTTAVGAAAATTTTSDGGTVADAPSRLDATALAAVPSSVCGSATRENTLKCAACKAKFKDGIKCQLLLSCDHRFHARCVEKWYPNCPVCRSREDTRTTELPV